MMRLRESNYDRRTCFIRSTVGEMASTYGGRQRHVDGALKIVENANLEILDGPGDFPFAVGGYYAFYFLGPDDLKFEVVHMPDLDK